MNFNTTQFFGLAGLIRTGSNYRCSLELVPVHQPTSVGLHTPTDGQPLDPLSDTHLQCFGLTVY